MSWTWYDVRPNNWGDIGSQWEARAASSEFEGGPKMGPKGGCGPVGRAPLGHFLPGLVCLGRWLLPALLLHQHRGQGCLHSKLIWHLVQATASTTHTRNPERKLYPSRHSVEDRKSWYCQRGPRHMWTKKDMVNPVRTGFGGGMRGVQQLLVLQAANNVQRHRTALPSWLPIGRYTRVNNQPTNQRISSQYQIGCSVQSNIVQTTLQTIMCQRILYIVEASMFTCFFMQNICKISE